MSDGVQTVAPAVSDMVGSSAEALDWLSSRRAEIRGRNGEDNSHTSHTPCGREIKRTALHAAADGDAKRPFRNVELLQPVLHVRISIVGRRCAFEGHFFLLNAVSAVETASTFLVASPNHGTGQYGRQGKPSPCDEHERTDTNRVKRLARYNLPLRECGV